MPISIGRYREPVTIEAPVETIVADASQHTEDTGQVVDDWTTFATPYAHIEAVTGGETTRGDQVSAETTHVVEMYYLPGLDHTMRLRRRQFDPTTPARALYFVKVLPDYFSNRVRIEAREDSI